LVVYTILAEMHGHTNIKFHSGFTKSFRRDGDNRRDQKRWSLI